MDKSFENTLSGCRQVLLQGQYLLEKMSDQQYQTVPDVFSQSSIGQHFRHIFDLWFALVKPLSKTDSTNLKFDYDNRRRGASVERSRELALVETRELLCWIETLKQNVKPEHPVTVSTEVGLDQSLQAQVTSTVLRELVFVSSHATHHFALIRQLATVQGIDVLLDFGMAPATCSFLRESVQ